MPKARVGNVELEYDFFGEREAAPLLLIMGLGGQMTVWEDDFCQQLADRGHFVVRFDNRDVGLSTWFDEAGLPDLLKVFTDGMAGKPIETPYTLDDMADDAVGVLDALGIDAAHICGTSMGGMIAQTVAIRHPSRVSSLTSIMSTTGDRSLPPPSPEAQAVLATPMPTEREAFIAESVRRDGVVGSPGHPRERAYVEGRAARLYDRAFHPEGGARQMLAIAAHEDRTPKLRELDVATLVIHGKADPLVPLSSGLATHEAIPDAELLLIEGMGHDLPRPVWQQVIDGIANLTNKVGAKA